MVENLSKWLGKFWRRETKESQEKVSQGTYQLFKCLKYVRVKGCL